MNLESLVKSEYFRSYWIQRNASVVRRYWAEVADVKRTADTVTETRVLPACARCGGAGARGFGLRMRFPGLLALVPPEAGLYKASRVGESSEVAALIVQKLIGPQPQAARDWRDAPVAVSPDSPQAVKAIWKRASTNNRCLRTPAFPIRSPRFAGWSTRPAVPRVAAGSIECARIGHVRADGVRDRPRWLAQDWDRDTVQGALYGAAAGRLWTTSRLGAGWVSGTAGRHSIERFDGLGTLIFAARGRRLFLSNDTGLLARVLDRNGSVPTTGALDYAAGFRHLLERSNYRRVMTALDFGSSAEGDAPPFFSGNIGSLSGVLSGIAEIQVTEEERGSITRQTVVYRMGQ
jgi:hypothetical protein